MQSQGFVFTRLVSGRLVSALPLVAVLASSHLSAAEPPRNAATAPAPRQYPAFALSSDLPFDVDADRVRALVKRGDVIGAHRLFTVLAWQAFVALNWPAEESGEPSTSKNLSDNTSWRVWHHWRSAGSIFLPDGATPQPWTGTLDQAKRPRNLAKHLPGRIGARDNFEAFTGPLVDQNGKWARFEIRVNKTEFDYIVKNELYNLDGQVAFSRREQNNQVNFPANGGGRHGAIEIKLAWKEMGPNDDRSRFYVTELEVTPSEPKGAQPPTKVLTVGLVGMHISMRTKSAPEWIWSTFEHVDNVRVNKYPDGRPTRPNFFNPNSKEAANQMPPKNARFADDGFPVPDQTDAADTWIESLTTTPTQVTRVEVPTQPGLNPLDKALSAVPAELNKEVQALLSKAGSVFQYYELIDTQWPLHPSAPAFPGGEGSAPESVRFKTPGEMIPVFLINTTMETYFQRGDQPAGGSEQDNRLNPPGDLFSAKGKKQLQEFGALSLTDSTRINGTESCVGCHYSAGIAIGFRKDANGNEILKNGVPVPFYGENSNFGNNGNAHFSWMLQQEPKAKPRKPAATAAPGKAPTAGR